jgi:hypothetical protein
MASLIMTIDSDSEDVEKFVLAENSEKFEKAEKAEKV